MPKKVFDKAGINGNADLRSSKLAISGQSRRAQVIAEIDARRLSHPLNGGDARERVWHRASLCQLRS